jgi:adenine-specific DNA-methyltransferase
VRQYSNKSADYELGWVNKDLVLVTSESGQYEWVDPTDWQRRYTYAIGLVESVGSRDASTLPNRLFQGDALDAVAAILRNDDYRSQYEGRVRLVYVDPPFNKGQGFGHYTDVLRHSAWLSMLRDRIEVIRPLLAPAASIWVHLDDAESHRARLVLDELFGEDAFVATVVWQKKATRESRSAISTNHDYIHVYAPDGPREWKRACNRLPPNRHTTNRDGDPRGPWVDAPFTAPGFRPNQHYPIVNPAGATLWPPKGRSWYATQDAYEALRADNRIWFPSNGAGSPRLKRFDEAGLVPHSIWPVHETGSNDEATRHLMGLFPDRPPFATPKPEPLLKRIVHIASDPGDLVADLFAGSGTTAAVAHKMGRRWLAVELSTRTIDEYFAPRLRAVVEGRDAGGITPSVNWQGGGSYERVAVRRVKSSPSVEDNELAIAGAPAQVSS